MQVEYDNGKGKLGVTVLNRRTREGPTKKMAFGQRTEGGGGAP